MRSLIVLTAVLAVACGNERASGVDPAADGGVVAATPDAGPDQDGGVFVAPVNIWPEPGPAVQTLSAPPSAQALHSFTLPAAPGESYSMVGNARRVGFGTPGASGGLQVAFLDGNSPPNVLATVGGLGVTSSSWVTPFSRGTAPAGTAAVRLSLSAALGAEMEFSDILAARLPPQ